VAELSQADLEQLAQDGMECTVLPGEPVGLLAALAESGLAKSRGEARKLVMGKGVRVNGACRPMWSASSIGAMRCIGVFICCVKGKKSWHMLVRMRGTRVNPVAPGFRGHGVRLIKGVAAREKKFPSALAKGKRLRIIRSPCPGGHLPGPLFNSLRTEQAIRVGACNSPSNARREA
jgi:hypothetical protein